MIYIHDLKIFFCWKSFIFNFYVKCVLEIKADSILHWANKLQL